MKKLKRILALIGVIILFALYISTIVFAIMDTAWSRKMFGISVAATFIIPALIYFVLLFVKISKPVELPEDVKKAYEEDMKKEIDK